jgi:hypothetical protein
MQEDTAEVAKLLRLIADGKTLTEIFGKKFANRPPDPLKLEWRVSQVVLLQRSSEEGGADMKVGQAIGHIATSESATKGTIRRDYYSDEGQAIRRRMAEELEQARANGTSSHWVPKR